MEFPIATKQPAMVVILVVVAWSAMEGSLFSFSHRQFQKFVVE
jgi:low affinity Fe/Cu permease